MNELELMAIAQAFPEPTRAFIEDCRRPLAQALRHDLGWSLKDRLLGEVARVQSALRSQQRSGTGPKRLIISAIEPHHIKLLRPISAPFTREWWTRDRPWARQALLNEKVVVLESEWKQRWSLEARTLLGAMRPALSSSGDGVLQHLGAIARLAPAWAQARVSAVTTLSDPNISGVLLSNPFSLWNAALTREAKARGLPVIAVQHGHIESRNIEWRHASGLSLLVWGSYHLRVMADHGVDREQVRIVGRPGWRPIVREPNSNEILVAMSGPGDSVKMGEHLEHTRSLARIVDGAPNSRWHIRLHRKDRAELYPDRLRSTAGRVRWTEDARASETLEQSLSKARLVITVTSTVALEGAASRVPVVALARPDSEPQPDFVRLGLVPSLRPSEILRLLDSEAPPSPSADVFEPGDAIQRSVAAIRSLISEVQDARIASV